MSEWHKVGDEHPACDALIEVVGYATTCCQLDAEREISIQVSRYNGSRELYNLNDPPGYFILPLFWRYLEKPEDKETQEPQSVKEKYKNGIRYLT